MLLVLIKIMPHCFLFWSVTGGHHKTEDQKSNHAKAILCFSGSHPLFPVQQWDPSALCQSRRRCIYGSLLWLHMKHSHYRRKKEVNGSIFLHNNVNSADSTAYFSINLMQQLNMQTHFSGFWRVRHLGLNTRV